LDLKRDLAELKSGSVQHKKELDRFLDEDESRLSDPYSKIMIPFLNEASSELSRLSDQVQFTERTYMEALRYFGEGPDPKRRGFPAPAAMRTEDFFGIFKEFQASYKKVKIANIKIGEQRALEAKRRAAAEEKEKERMEAKARKDAGVDDGAVLETLLGNLRSGGLTGKPKRKARERGEARRSGRTSEVLNPKDQAGNDSLESDSTTGMTATNSELSTISADGETISVTPPVPGSPVEPSDKALSLLAQLQGGSSSPKPTTPPQRTRRRERRNVESGTSSRDRDSQTSAITRNSSSRLSQPPWNGEGEKVDEEKPEADEADITQTPMTLSFANMSTESPAADQDQDRDEIEPSEGDEEEEVEEQEGRNSPTSDYSEAETAQDDATYDPAEAARLDEEAIEADKSADSAQDGADLDWYDPADLSFNSR